MSWSLWSLGIYNGNLFACCKRRAVLLGFIYVLFLVSDTLCNSLCHTSKLLALEAINPEYTSVRRWIPRFMRQLNLTECKRRRGSKGRFQQLETVKMRKLKLRIVEEEYWNLEKNKIIQENMEIEIFMCFNMGVALQIVPLSWQNQAYIISHAKCLILLISVPLKGVPSSRTEIIYLDLGANN